MSLNAGWGYPMNARKAHYFPEFEGKSLCGRWLFTGSRSDDMPGPDDCLVCARTLLDRQTGDVLGFTEAERARSINRLIAEHQRLAQAQFPKNDGGQQ